MAYTKPAESDILVSAESVAQNAYCTVAIVRVKHPGKPVVFYIKSDKIFNAYFGTSAKSSTTKTDLDQDTTQDKSDVPATSVFGTKKYTVFPDAYGYCWCTVQNTEVAAATVTIYGGQPVIASER